MCRIKSLNQKTTKETGSINCKVLIYSKRYITGAFVIVPSLLTKITIVQEPAGFVKMICLIYKAFVKHMMTVEL